VFKCSRIKNKLIQTESDYPHAKKKISLSFVLWELESSTHDRLDNGFGPTGATDDCPRGGESRKLWVAVMMIVVRLTVVWMVIVALLSFETVAFGTN